MNKRYITFLVTDKGLLNLNKVYTGEIVHEWGNAYKVKVTRANGSNYWIMPMKGSIKVLRTFCF